VIEYRSFSNPDPPHLVALWHACQLGRGAASGVSTDIFEALNLSQSYFDPHGLTVACDGKEIIGYSHAGFGSNADGSGLSTAEGIICAVMVHPKYRRQGIGRRLIEHAEHFLEAAPTEKIHAGPAPPRDPFYTGMYGGTQPAGFLESDPNAAPFFAALGYEPVERHLIFQRDISRQSNPVNYQLVNLRRKTELVISNQPENVSWWWLTRFGRLDSVRFSLMHKDRQPVTAAASAVGLDLYMGKWNERAVGITDIVIADASDGPECGQLLLHDICRRLREEVTTRVEAHAPESDVAAVELLEATGFTQVDAGVVYRRTSDSKGT